jgi:hypothetical protein
MTTAAISVITKKSTSTTIGMPTRSVNGTIMIDA